MRRRWVWVGVTLLVLVGAGALLLKRGGGPTTAVDAQKSATRAERKSFWRAPPRLQNGDELPVATAPPPAPRPKGPALQVVIEDATGGPIGGATITVKDQLMGVTDESGRCDIAVDAPGFAPTGILAAKAAGYTPGTSEYAAPGRLLVQLLPGSRISGIVVEAGTGHPVPGLEVSITGHSTTSDADGQFALRDIAAGKHHVSAVGPHHAGGLAQPVSVGIGAAVEGLRLEVAATYVITGRILSQGQPLHHSTLVMGAGTSDQSDPEGKFELRGVRPGTHRLKLKVTGPSFFGMDVEEAEVKVTDRDVVKNIDVGLRHSIVVEVRDRDGRRLEKVKVRCQQQSKGGFKNEGCTTDATGACSFEGLRPGEIVLKVDGGKRPTLTTAVPAAQPARFVLDEVASIEGKVVTPSGPPSDTRHIRLTSAAGGRPDHEQSGPGGVFAFRGLGAGTYTLEVFANYYPQSPALRLATLPVTLAASEAQRDLVLTVPDADARLTGQVVDAAGRPVADVLVSSRLSGTGSSPEATFRQQPPLAVTDGDGRFTLPRRLASLHYDVAALAPDGSQGQVAGAAPNTSIVIRLLPRGSLSVQVPNHTGMMTMVTILDEEKVVATSAIFAEGVSAQFDGLLPGPRTVRVGHPPRHAETKVEIRAGVTAKVTLPLP